MPGRASFGNSANPPELRNVQVLIMFVENYDVTPSCPTCNCSKIKMFTHQTPIVKRTTWKIKKVDEK